MGEGGRWCPIIFECHNRIFKVISCRNKKNSVGLEIRGPFLLKSYKIIIYISNRYQGHDICSSSLFIHTSASSKALYVCVWHSIWACVPISFCSCVCMTVCMTVWVWECLCFWLCASVCVRVSVCVSVCDVWVECCRKSQLAKLEIFLRGHPYITSRKKLEKWTTPPPLSRSHHTLIISPPLWRHDFLHTPPH